MDWMTIIGMGGTLLMLFGFILNEFHILDRDGLVYDGINFIGGVLLITYSWFLDSVPFLVLNVAWTLVALRDIIKDLRR